MNVRHRTPLRLVEPVSAEVRVITRSYTSLQGPETLVAVGEDYFWVGEMTLNRLKRGATPDDCDLIAVDPDDEPAPEYPEEGRRCSIADRIIRSRKEQI